jgi:hypothetical protein
MLCMREWCGEDVTVSELRRWCSWAAIVCMLGSGTEGCVNEVGDLVGGFCRI